jgi:hypothetical protein
VGSVAAKLPPITEAEFQRQVLDIAKLFRWTVAHFRPAQTSRGWRTPVSADGKGFPDLCMVRGDRIVFAELKREKAKLTDEQVGWIKLLQQTQAEVYVWYPLEIDQIAELLR